MIFGLDWSVVFGEPGRSMLLSGILTTLQVLLWSAILSTILGLIVALLRVTNTNALRPLRWLCTAYVEFFRNVPVLVQIAFWGFGIFGMAGVRALASPINEFYPNPFLAGVCALSVYQSTYMSEAFRSGLQSVPVGLIEAARASGLGYLQSRRYVVVPQMFRLSLPAVGAQYIALTKNTTIVMFLGVGDVLFQAQEIESDTFRAFEAFSAAIVIIAAMCLIEGMLLSLISSRMGLTQGGGVLKMGGARKGLAWTRSTTT